MNMNKFVTANFTLTSRYTLTIAISGSGTVTKIPNQPLFNLNQTVQLKANPSPGWSFSHWSGNFTGSMDSISITMTSNKTIMATFFYSGGNGGTPPPTTVNQRPVADLSIGEPYKGYVNSAILFNGSRSYDPDGKITKWFWVFGDNTNGTGMTVRHTYSKAETYRVTLTVFDNEGATNTSVTICEIKQRNGSLTLTIINETTNGTKNQPYNYTVVSTDLDNFPIQYIFDWGDFISQSSGFVPNANGKNFTVNHSWAAAGRYDVTVTVTDNQTVSSSKIIVYIDALQTRGVGYLIDKNGDRIYDWFYSDVSKQTTAVQKKGDTYIIDSNGDGDVEYTYNETNGLTDYKPPNTPGFEIVLFICAIIVTIVLWKKKRIV
jgi:PKD repeat protein